MWTREKRREALRLLCEFARPHRHLLVKGGLATIGVVLFRLAMPWPLRGVVELVFRRHGDGAALLADRLLGWGDPLLWLGGLYLVVAAGCGGFEALQRVWLAKFAARAVHDLRRAAVRGAIRKSGRDRLSTGELVARIIGDSARVKSGLSGILVHGLQNGLLFLGVCAVLVAISTPLGAILATAGLLTILIGWLASGPIARTTHKHRKKEGQYAAALEEGLDQGRLDLEEEDGASARKDVKATKLLALASLAVHLVLAVTVVAALWHGMREVGAGTMSPGELFLFIAYALTVHRRLVHVGRQTARTGKVLACVHRIGRLIDVGAPGALRSSATPAPLRSGLRLERVKLEAGHWRCGKPRLRRTSLTLAAGSRVGVLGGVGDGKSSLLRLLAGREPGHKGKIVWDDEEVPGDGFTLSCRVGFLPQEPAFPWIRVRKLLGLEVPGAPTPEETETLRRIGAWKIIGRLPGGVDEKVISSQLSRNEARALALAALLLRDQSALWALDDPLEGLSRKKGRRRLKEILRRASGRTVVIALSRPTGLERFDRILELRRGRVRFEGTPAERKAWKSTKKTLAPGGSPDGPARVTGDTGGVRTCKR